MLRLLGVPADISFPNGYGPAGIAGLVCPGERGGARHPRPLVIRCRARSHLASEFYTREPAGARAPRGELEHRDGAGRRPGARRRVAREGTGRADRPASAGGIPQRAGGAGRRTGLRAICRQAWRGRVTPPFAQRSKPPPNECGLDLYYVPSMRNGEPSRSDEDRGNAILSSLAISDFSAIELPFERQRRVAVAATISGTSSKGERVAASPRVDSPRQHRGTQTRVVCRCGAGTDRGRSAACIDYLKTEDFVVLGGDFNTWSGFDERAYREAARAFPDTSVTDRRPTFGGHLRLDHLFFRLGDGWRSEFRRADSSYGSDHFPLIATVTLP